METTTIYGTAKFTYNKSFIMAKAWELVKAGFGTISESLARVYRIIKYVLKSYKGNSYYIKNIPARIKKTGVKADKIEAEIYESIIKYFSEATYVERYVVTTERKSTTEVSRNAIEAFCSDKRFKITE